MHKKHYIALSDVQSHRNIDYTGFFIAMYLNSSKEM